MKLKKIGPAVIFVAAVASFLSLLIRHSETRSSDVIAIGVLAPKTGFMSGHGQSMEMGAEVAGNYLNAHGGVLGKKVKLYIMDTTSEPAGSAERAKELIDRFNVDLLVGTGTSASTLAAIPSATAAKVPFIYALDGECKTCKPGAPGEVNRYVYGSGFTERMVVKPFLRYLGAKLSNPGQAFTIYFFGGDYVYPRTTNTYARQVAESLGYQTVGDEYSDTSTVDYSPVIRRIRDAKPRLLIVTNPGASGVTFMRQALQLGLKKEMMISGFATFDQEAIDAMGEASEGIYAVNRYSKELDNHANQNFVEAFRKEYPDQPLLPGPTAAAGMYGSILVAAKAFAKAGSTGPEKFYDAMRGLEMELPQGKVRVNPDNNIFDQHIYILKIHKQQYEIMADLGMQSHPDLEGCSVR